jgi:hypothetical protein
MLIAAIALANGLTVVTHNTAEFGRAPDCSSRTGRRDSERRSLPVGRALRLDLVGPRPGYPPTSRTPPRRCCPSHHRGGFLTGFLVPHEAFAH